MLVDRHGRPWKWSDYLPSLLGLFWWHRIGDRNFQVYSMDGYPLFGRYHPDRGPSVVFYQRGWSRCKQPINIRRK